MKFVERNEDKRKNIKMMQRTEERDLRTEKEEISGNILEIRAQTDSTTELQIIVNGGRNREDRFMTIIFLKE